MCRLHHSFCFITLSLMLITIMIAPESLALNCGLCGYEIKEDAKKVWWTCTNKECKNHGRWHTTRQNKFLKTTLSPKIPTSDPRPVRLIEGNSVPPCLKCKGPRQQRDKWLVCRTSGCEKNGKWVTLTSANKIGPDNGLNWKADIFGNLPLHVKTKLRAFHQEKNDTEIYSLDQLMIMLDDESTPTLLEKVQFCTTRASYRETILLHWSGLTGFAVDEVERAVQALVTFNTVYNVLFAPLDMSHQFLFGSTAATPIPDLNSRLTEFETELPKGSIAKMLSFCEQHEDLGFVEPSEITEEDDIDQIMIRIRDEQRIIIVGTFNQYYQYIYLTPYRSPFDSIFSKSAEPKTLSQVQIHFPEKPTLILDIEELAKALPQLWQAFQMTPWVIFTHQDKTDKAPLRKTSTTVYEEAL